MKRTLVVIGAWAGVRLLLLPIIDPLLMQGDDAYYVAAARDLLHATERPPGYPLFLAATLWLGTYGVFAVQSLMVLGAAIFTRYRMGFRTGLAIAACPFFPFFEWSLLSEILSLVLLWCGWLLAFYPRRRWEFFAGAGLIGLALLTRDILLLLPLTAFLCVKWRKALAFCAIAYLPIALWTLHAPSQGRFGFNLWIGTWERNGDWKLHGIDQWPDYARATPELQKAFREHDDKPFVQATVERYRNDPGFVLRSWIARYRYLWFGTRTELTRLTLERGSPQWIAFKSLMFALNTLMLGLGIVGAFRRRSILVLPVAYVALVYVPLHNTEMRYSLIAVPFLLALGQEAVITGSRRAQVGKQRVELGDERSELGRRWCCSCGAGSGIDCRSAVADPEIPR